MLHLLFVPSSPSSYLSVLSSLAPRSWFSSYYVGPFDVCVANVNGRMKRIGNGWMKRMVNGLVFDVSYPCLCFCFCSLNASDVDGRDVCDGVRGGGGAGVLLNATVNENENGTVKPCDQSYLYPCPSLYLLWDEAEDFCSKYDLVQVVENEAYVHA